MDTYIFTGKVLPERADVHIPTMTIDISSNTEGAQLEGRIIISIKYSQISATLIVETNQDVPTLKNSVEHMVKTLVDSFGYLSGRGYDTEITTCTDSQGNLTVFGIGIPELESEASQRPLNLIDLYTRSVSPSKDLQHALGNLRESIRSQWDTGFFCYRAVECIRKYFVQEGDSNDNSSWERLRGTLRIDRSWIDVIKNTADEQRHGYTPEFTYEERVRIMKHAWKIIDRFSIFMMNNQENLSESDFEILTEEN